MTTSERDSLRSAVNRYEERLAGIAETRQGAPRSQVLQELIEATAEASGCIPVRQLEVMARRISDGEPIEELTEKEHIA